MFISPTAFCQNEKIITISAKQQPLVSLLNDFQKQSQIRLAYANKMVDSLHVSVKISDPPFEALKKLLQSTPLDFLQQQPDLWVIVPRKQTAHLPGAITGVVRDFQSGQPIFGSNLILHHHELGTTTDSSGSFLIDAVRPGHYLLGVRRIGYANQDLGVTVPGNSRRKLSISLSPRPVMMQELKIEKNRLIELSPSSLATQNLSQREFAVSPLQNGSNGDLFELIHRLPGISRRDLNDVFPHIEGGSADETLVEIDGMPINISTFGGNYRSVFSMQAIENISIARSAYSAQHVDVLSGSIALRSRDLPQAGSKFIAGLGDRGAMLSVEASSGRIGYLGVWQGNAVENAYSWQGLPAQTFFSKVFYHTDSGHQISLLTLLGRNAFTQTNTIAIQQQTNYSLGVKVEMPQSSDSGASFLAYRSGMPGHFHETGFKFDAVRKNAGPFRLAFGVHLFHLRSEGAAPLDSVRTYKSTGISFLDYPEFPANLFGQRLTHFTPYASFGYSAGPYRAEFGLRLPTNLQSFAGKPSPRAKLILQPVSHMALSLGFGRYFQMVNRNYAAEAKSGDSPDRGEYVVAGTEARQDRADHLRAEMTWDFLQQYRLTVAGFYKAYAFANRSYLLRINTQFWFLPVATANSAGLEMSVAKSFGAHRGWLSYTLNQVEYTNESGIAFQPYFARDHLFTATMQHKLSPFVYLSWLYAEESGYPARNWLDENDAIDPEFSAEAFANTFFATSRETGARNRLGMALRWFFAGPQKQHTIEFYLAKSIVTDIFPDATNWQFSVFLNLIY